MPISTIGTNSLSATAQIGSLTTASGSAPSYSARAWVNFNGTGTVAIRASGNVTSITDNGTGDYTVNITTALTDVNYAVTGETGGTASVASLGLADQITARTTTAFRVYVFTTTGGLIDAAQVNIAVFR